MITYNWNCKQVDTRPIDGEKNDVIYNVHWRVTGATEQEGEQYTYISIGTQQLNTKDLTDFVKFEDITHPQIVEWTKESMGEKMVSDIEANISSSIEENINPTSVLRTIE